MSPLHQLISLAVLLLSAFAQAAAPPTIPPAKDTEPSVSEPEAALLERAAEKAKASPSEAATLLASQDTPEGSAAMPFAEAVYWSQAGELDRATEAVLRALARQPRFHRARLNLAKLRIKQEQHAEAAAELQALLTTDTPDRAEVWRLLAYCLHELGQAPAAETAYRQAIAFSPTERELKLGLLACLVEQQKYATAVPMAKRELGEEPTRRQLWALLVNAELAADRRGKALRLLECARRLNAADAHMLTMLGELYLDDNLPTPALACYRQIAALEKAPASCLLSGLEALMMSRNYTEATQLAPSLEQRLDRLTPKQRLRYRSLCAGLAAASGDTDRALTAYRQVLADDPIDGKSLLALGELLSGRDRKQAKEFLERAARLDAYQVRAWTGLARIAVEEDDIAAAVVLVRRALAKTPDEGLERYLAQLRAALP